jgi:hypothetical protein
MCQNLQKRPERDPEFILKMVTDKMWVTQDGIKGRRFNDITTIQAMGLLKIASKEI